MIFVTVGLERFPFDRLIRCVDALVGALTIQEETFVQLGSSKTVPQNCTWMRSLEYAAFIDKICSARIVITHAGVGSIISCLRYRTIPIACPRQRDHGEHVDDHQVEFLRHLEELNTVIPVYDLNDLASCIARYDELAAMKRPRKDDLIPLMNYLENFILGCV
jgi:UDP-N-acetylglucosamine transferase subunit ALG13